MPSFALQLLQQLQQLGLDGDVDGRGGLVGDQQVRIVGERHGDHHALALPARELVRIGGEPLLRLRNADEPQQLERAQARLRAVQPLMQDQHLVDLLLDGVQRIERGHRLLEHHGDVVAADIAQLRFGRADQLLAAKALMLPVG